MNHILYDSKNKEETSSKFGPTKKEKETKFFILYYKYNGQIK